MTAELARVSDAARHEAIGSGARTHPARRSVAESMADSVAALEGGAQAKVPLLQAVLSRTIERAVVPRLLLAERSRVAALQVAAPEPAEIAALVQLSLRGEGREAIAFVEQRQAGGLALETIYLDLLAPAMRELGRLWEEDLADFGQVTIATERLRQVMRTFSLSQAAMPAPQGASRRILLVPAPGDQHSFGLAMVSEFFGRAGWHRWAGVPDSTDHLLQMVRRDWFGIISFSVSTILRMDALSEAIRKVRRLSRNRAIGVMVGGPVFLEHPEMVALVGADATAADGRQAVLQARALLDLAQARA